MPRITEKLIPLALLAVFSLEGCAILSEELLTLKSVGDSQKEIGKYVVRQEKFFLRLFKHYEKNKLRVGTNQRKIVGLYGEPIAVYTWGDAPKKEYYLYRHPTNYFQSDKIYLYFDESKKLVCWEYKPHLKQSQEDQEGGLSDGDKQEE